MRESYIYTYSYIYIYMEVNNEVKSDNIEKTLITK